MAASLTAVVFDFPLHTEIFRDIIPVEVKIEHDRKFAERLKQYTRTYYNGERESHGTKVE